MTGSWSVDTLAFLGATVAGLIGALGGLGGGIEIRVAAMLALFLWQGDRLYALITTLVLAILAIGVLSGLEL